MAKQRNSLGLLVFPTTDNESISWDEYKKRTGIDLEKIFVIGNAGDDENPSYYVRVREGSPSKLFVMSSDGPEKEPMLPKILVPTSYTIHQDTTLDDAYFGMAVVDTDSGYGCEFHFQGNKTMRGGNY